MSVRLQNIFNQELPAVLSRRRATKESVRQTDINAKIGNALYEDETQRLRQLRVEAEGLFTSELQVARAKLISPFVDTATATNRNALWTRKMRLLDSFNADQLVVEVVKMINKAGKSRDVDLLNVLWIELEDYLASKHVGMDYKALLLQYQSLFLSASYAAALAEIKELEDNRVIMPTLFLSIQNRLSDGGVSSTKVCIGWNGTYIAPPSVKLIRVHNSDDTMTTKFIDG